MIKHKSKKGGRAAEVAVSSHSSLNVNIGTQPKMGTDVVLSNKSTDISIEKHFFDIKLINLNAANKLILNNNYPNIETEIVEMIKTINKNSLGELKNIVNAKIDTIDTIDDNSTDADIQQIYQKVIQDYKTKLNDNSLIIEKNLNEFKKKLTKGGGVLQHLYDNTGPNLEAVEYIQYVKDRGDPDVIADYENKDLALIQTIVRSKNIREIRTNILNNIDALHITPNDYNKYDSFFKFIFSNKDKVGEQKTLEIPAEEKFEITNLQTNGVRKFNGNRGNILRYTYDAYNYNEDIVIDFERKLYENQEYITEFMTKQNDFIDTNLTPGERWTIRDYTSYTANPFYGAYKTSKILKTSDWFNRYKVDAKNYIMNFDNAYLPQILKYIKSKREFNALETYINDNLETLVNIVSDYGELSLDERYSRDVADVRNKILFTQEDWEKILDIFEEDVNNIIKKMPTPEKPIYCYRGVTYHYVSLDAWDARVDAMGGNPDYSLNCYYLSRITSLSLDFDKAKFFYESLDSGRHVNPDKHLYRAVIMPGCNMLFVSSLSALPEEYEIILPTYSLVLDAKGWNDQLTTPALKKLDEYQNAFNVRTLDRIKYNNRTNVNGICGRKQDKLISSDIVIIGTFEKDHPQHRPFGV
jgi:hypothetical protein